MSDALNDVLDFANKLRTSNKPANTKLKVDPYFYEIPEIAKILEYAMSERPTKNVLIVGPTGCGKSSLAINVMARLSKEAEIFSCDGETSTDNLIGKLIARPNEKGDPTTEVVLGAALRAYKTGKGLLLEEVDIASPEVLASLHRIMENHSGHYICNIGAEDVIDKNPDFFVIGTANTIGTGEDTFLYAGTKPLNQAFMNRFSITVEMDYLGAMLELKVVTDKTGINRDLAEGLISIANDVRNASNPTRIGGMPGSQKLVSTISTRDLLEWAQLISRMNLSVMDAAKYAFLNRASVVDRDIIKEFITNKGL